MTQFLSAFTRLIPCVGDLMGDLIGNLLYLLNCMVACMWCVPMLETILSHIRPNLNHI